jgi:N-acetylglutamate synthase
MYEDFETMQMRAWPAERESWMGSWRLRFSRGFSNRSNSATPLGGLSRAVEAHRIEKTEAAYREASIVPCFRLRDDPECLALDRSLEDRGYAILNPTLVKTVSLGEALSRLSDGPSLTKSATLVLRDAFDDEWIQAYAELNGRSKDAAEYARTLKGVRVRARTALILDGGLPAAAGSAIHDSSGSVERPGPWVGFYDLAVAPSLRGRGYGKEILSALLRDSISLGNERGYLAVMEDNPPALGLYEKAGFTDLYRYWYRKAPPR